MYNPHSPTSNLPSLFRLIRILYYGVCVVKYENMKSTNKCVNSLRETVVKEKKQKQNKNNKKTLLVADCRSAQLSANFYACKIGGKEKGTLFKCLVVLALEH